MSFDAFEPLGASDSDDADTWEGTSITENESEDLPDVINAKSPQD